MADSRPTAGGTGPPAGAGERPPALPDRLGATRLVRPIGRGGMGTVWLGRHELLERDVAVKFLHRAVADESDPDFRMFIDGARAAAAVRHAGLTMIHDAGLHAGVPYLVMEYVDGPTVADLLRDGPLEPHAALAVLAAVCEAVAELHDQGIIHRDIKPSNILVASDGRILVTDFGLSCSRPVGALGPSMERVGGTPAYMAPEMFGGVASTRSDVYALGVTAFELLTGRAPFDGSLADLRFAHQVSPPPVEKLRQRGVDDGVVVAIERAMNKDAKFRPKTARHVLEALPGSARDPVLLQRGRNAIAAAAARGPGERASGAAVATPSSSYYEQLRTMAERKRTPTPNSLAPEAISRPAEARKVSVPTDLPCIDCGYSLRGLPTDGVCPECGATVSASIDPRRLLFAEPEWLWRVDRGLALLRFRRVPRLIWVGALGIGVVAAFFPQDRYPLKTVGAVPFTLLLGVWCAAIVLITAPEPGERKTWLSLRRCARVCGLTTGVASIALLVWFVGGQVIPALTWHKHHGLRALILAAMLGGLVVYAWWFRRLCARAGEARAALFCASLAVAGVAVAAVVLGKAGAHAWVLWKKGLLAKWSMAPETAFFDSVPYYAGVAASYALLVIATTWLLQATLLRGVIARLLAGNWSACRALLPDETDTASLSQPPPASSAAAGLPDGGFPMPRPPVSNGMHRTVQKVWSVGSRLGVNAVPLRYWAGAAGILAAAAIFPPDPYRVLVIGSIAALIIPAVWWLMIVRLTEPGAAGPGARMIDADSGAIVGTVVTDVPCISCQYNLRGIRSDGVCPECATPTIKSLHASRFPFSDVGWLRRVVHGLELSIGARRYWLAWVGAGVAYGASSAPLRPPLTSMWALSLMVADATMIMPIVMVTGVAVALCREPSGRDSRLNRVRRLARAGVLVGGAAMLLALPVLHLRLLGLPWRADPVSGGLGWLALTVFAVPGRSGQAGHLATGLGWLAFAAFAVTVVPLTQYVDAFLQRASSVSPRRLLLALRVTAWTAVLLFIVASLASNSVAWFLALVASLFCLCAWLRVVWIWLSALRGTITVRVPLCEAIEADQRE